MEVHAHSHTYDPDIHRDKKKWTHYFWEFLMLFLAVFCGFLAENFREHQVEHQREKKYIYSLIADLKGDTAEINSVIEYNIEKFPGMDTLAMLLRKDLLTDADERALYFLNSKYAANIYTMIFNDRTIRQLLNSGNLRLVSRHEISDSIMSYYGQPKDDILGQEKVYEEMSIRLILAAEEIFDQSVRLARMNPDRTFYRDKQPEKIKLMTHEKKALTKYAQMVRTARGFLSVYLSLLFDMQLRAKGLLTFLEKEYHLR